VPDLMPMSASGADPTSPLFPVHISARGISFNFALHCGIVSAFVVQDKGRKLSMIHRAPWAGSDTPLPPGAPPHQAHLEGDFFCAPFSDATADNAPLHGWPANGLWQVSGETDARTLRCTLHQTVMGAAVQKTLSLTDGHPFLYQQHVFTGGQGAIATANHAMISLPNGGQLRFSPKRWFETPADAPETNPARGRSRLRYPARSADPRHFPAADGTMIDITHYPFGPAHEDFVIGVESPDSPLGWTAITRPKERDLYLSLRHPKHLPMTMLWHSNGGRDYPPWNGNHKACLGLHCPCCISHATKTPIFSPIPAKPARWFWPRVSPPTSAISPAASLGLRLRRYKIFACQAMKSWFLANRVPGASFPFAVIFWASETASGPGILCQPRCKLAKTPCQPG
jgi:hypothetical protein